MPPGSRARTCAPPGAAGGPVCIPNWGKLGETGRCPTQSPRHVLSAAPAVHCASCRVPRGSPRGDPNSSSLLTLFLSPFFPRSHPWVFAPAQDPQLRGSPRARPHQRAHAAAQRFGALGRAGELGNLNKLCGQERHGEESPVTGPSARSAPLKDPKLNEFYLFIIGGWGAGAGEKTNFTWRHVHNPVCIRSVREVTIL